MKVDPKKCHFISISNDGVNLKNENQIMANIKCEKRLDMKFDCKLSMLTLMTFAKNNC